MNLKKPLASLALAYACSAHADTASPPALSDSLGQLGLGLGVVIVVLLIALWGLKRLTGPRGGSAGLMHVLGAVQIGTRERAVLLEVADKVILVGVSAHNVNALHTFDAADIHARINAAGGAPGQDFSRWLGKALERRNPDAR